MPLPFAAMEPLETIARVYESEDPATAFDALLDALASETPLRAAFWRGPEPGSGESWPAEDPLAHGLLRGEPAALEPHRARLLLLPLPRSEGVLGLLPGSGAPLLRDPHLDALARALDRVLARHRQQQALEEERSVLRQRAEQSEALHVLGLAANRSLDLSEVLDLVARFARTLLGAHYVTVTSSAEGRFQTAASVGVRGELGPDGDPLAARVLAAGQPLALSEESDADVIEGLPFHRAEGMRAGLGVPLSLFGETVGALVVGYRRPYPLQSRDSRLALALAGHAAVAISNARLHQALAERSGELERAYEELRSSSERKQRFFAAMSHELRTPLNGILGYQSLLLDGIAGTLSGPQQEFVAKANRATHNLLRLVNDVLDLSKLDASKLELFVRPVELRGLVREVLGTIEPLAAAKSVRLVAEHESVPAVFETDSERVQQILLNLLSNAVKFTERGEVCLSAGVEPPARPQWLTLRVTDTGPGIRPEDQERIFHEFEQVLDAESRGGTGLGLSISRKLARLLGGDLTVQSRPGEGSTFTLRLPLAPVAGPDPQLAGTEQP